MTIAIVGCGYVFDHYMATWDRHPGLHIAGVFDIDAARISAVTKAYGLSAYASYDALLADPSVTIVVNLTAIEAHYAVTKSALLAGKHVYSEKPLVTDMVEARELIALAESCGLRLSCAPSNALSDTTQTMWKAVRDGAIGDVRIVYAEFDDNPIYLMQPEGWRSRTGAPWPYLHEYEMGCTFEHVGYHLTWLCAMFGPVESVTAFSRQTLPDKTDRLLTPADTPDFSVASLNFRSGVTARVTCSIAAPYDHRMRIIGNKGMLTADTYRDYRCPVYLERFSKVSMNARKAIAVRSNTLLQALFGIGGRKLRLLELPQPGRSAPAQSPHRWWHPKDQLQRLKRRQLGQQDKTIGIAELADAIATDRPQFPSHDFTLHLTELTLMIQRAGPNGTTHALQTTFAPVMPPLAARNAAIDYGIAPPRSLLSRLLDSLLDRLHQH